MCLDTWGFRRCDVITWLKTNHSASLAPSLSSSSSPTSSSLFLRSPNSLLLHTSEHCLVGVKGNIRSTDTSFIRPNLDVDVIIDEERECGDWSRPREIFHVIERFCLGRERIYLFACENDVRSGWLCVGEGVSGSNVNVLCERECVREKEMENGGEDEHE